MHLTFTALLGLLDVVDGYIYYMGGSYAGLTTCIFHKGLMKILTNFKEEGKIWVGGKNNGGG